MTRSLRTLVLLPLLLSAASLCTAAEKPVHLFILSGQSNMAGMKEAEGFLPEARRLLPDAEVVHLKVASSGKPIRLWLSEWDTIAAEAGLESKLVKEAPFHGRIVTGTKALREKHGAFASITFCWMQGERDAKEKLSPAYEAAMKALIANLRRDLEAPEMGFVIGRLSDHGNGQEHWDAVRAAQVKVATDDPRGAWADTDDTNDKEKAGKSRNDLHYTKEGYKLFGERLARQAVRIIRGEKPDPKGRPE